MIKKMNNEMVEAVFATTGDSKGEINLQWDAYENAQSYIIQISSADKKNFSWKHIDIVNDSTYTAASLKPGKIYAFRIAYISKSGQSRWSKPVFKKVK